MADLSRKYLPGRGVNLGTPLYLEDRLLIPPPQEIQYFHLFIFVLQQVNYKIVEVFRVGDEIRTTEGRGVIERETNLRYVSRLYHAT